MTIKTKVFSCILVAVVAAPLSAWSQTQLAQLRVYDSTSGKSLPVGSSTPAPTKVTPPAAVPSAIRRYTPQQGTVLTPQAPIKAPVQSQKLPAQRPPVVTQSRSEPQNTSLGSVLVFVKNTDINPAMVEKLKRINSLKRVVVSLYMHGDTPSNFVRMADKTLKYLPADMEFNVDIDHTLADSFSSKNKNIIIFKDKNGAVRYYDLANEFYNFMNHVERLQGGTS